MYRWFRKKQSRRLIAGVSVFLIVLLNLLWFAVPSEMVSANEKPTPNMIKADEKNDVKPGSGANGAAPGALPDGKGQDDTAYKAGKTFNNTFTYVLEVAKAVESISSSPSGGNIIVGTLGVVASGSKIFNEAGDTHWSVQLIEKGIDPALKAVEFRAAFNYQTVFTGAVNTAANVSWWTKLKNEFAWTTLQNGPASVFLAKVGAPFAAISAGFGVYDVVQGAKNNDGWKIAEGSVDIIGGLAGVALPFLLATPAAPIVAGIALGAAVVSTALKYRKEIAAAAKWVWNKGKELGRYAWNATKNFAANTWSAIKKTASQAWSATKQAASRAWAATKKTASRAWAATKKTASRAWAATKKTASRAWAATKKTASRAWSATKKTASRAWSATKKTASRAWSATKKTASRAWSATKKTASRAWSATKKTASRAWSATKKTASRAWSATKKTASRAWSATKKTASRAWSATKKTASRAWSSTKKTASRAWSATKKTASRAWSATKKTASHAWSSTKKTANRAWSSTKKTASRAWSSTRKAASSARNAIGGFFSNVRKSFG
ncbi:hypothetical protein P4V46_24145 [Brevibacillus borstelensis]|uniref:hypothetical protein n=1 Tax=Brevibacillus borstelensis TaxID=45462 RepID=UPI002E2151A3|nr:hypothetical protein [Brevibacillus borstelensis]